MRAVLLACAGMGLLPWSATADGLKAGAAKAEITPPTGYAMWGYGARKDAPSTGVRDPLHARALVVESGGARIALVSLDLGRAPPRDSFAAIRNRVKKAAGVEHLFLVASHTHGGPVLEVDTWPTKKTSYVRQLEDKLADLIAEAAKNVKPARLGVAIAEAAFNRNRHSKRDDKPVDRDLRVLRVEDEDGKAIAHAVSFAAHATMLDAKNMEFSADWPGAMAATIEKETKAPCLFLQGAAGDLSPDGSKGNTPEKFGEALAREALALAKTIKCKPLEKGTLRVREEEFKFESRVDFGNPLLILAFKQAFFPDLVAFYEREYKEGIRPRLTVALLDDRIGFVGVSGEFFCSHSLSLKKRARLEHVFFLGYCNDYQQYFPTIEAASEGGYGADAQVSPVELGAGERMVDRALIHLYQLRGKLAPLK